MRFFKICLPVLLTLSLLFSCVSSNNGGGKDIVQVVEETCYEVVVPRIEDEQIQYEKELPWDEIPYQIRNDEFLSIGTAFAVAPDRFITAAHVLSLNENSLFYQEYYIRDSQGNVYPITDLLRFHCEKDFVEFTVGGFTAENYLEFRDEPYIANETVYQVGNIYGQGIVAVPGTILGDMDEDRDGAWKYIKSSPPNDRGSSGGPLIDADMKVLGVIDFKDNNFSYSLPVGEIESSPENKGFIDSEFFYKFSLLMGEKSEKKPYVRELDLPQGLQAVKETLSSGYMANYEKNMNDFFTEAGGLFPEGRGSMEALQKASTSSGIEVLYRNEDDRLWYFSSLDKNHGRLGEDGYLSYSNIDGMVYFDIDLSSGASYEDFYSSPKSVMDTLLQGISVTRKLAGDEIRIDSLGEAFSAGEKTDKYGRKWHMDVWSLAYADQVIIMMWSAVPYGASGVLCCVSSAQMDMWRYDMGVIADLLYIPYSATLEEWSGYLGHPESSFGPYADMVFEYVPDGEFSLNSEEFSLEFTSDFLTVADTMMMTLTRDIYEEDDNFVWGLRKVNISESDKFNFFVSYHFIKPSSKLPEKFHREWQDFVEGQHPYNLSAYSLEGHTNIGTVNPQSDSSEGSAFSLYLGLEGNRSQEEMEERMNVLKSALNFHF